jgi:membrane dipeptidase
MPDIAFFDGHNDTLLKLWTSNAAETERPFLEGMPSAHIDLPRAKAGGMAGGIFAIFPPPLKGGDTTNNMVGQNYDLSLPPPLSLEAAQAATNAMA